MSEPKNPPSARVGRSLEEDRLSTNLLFLVGLGWPAWGIVLAFTKADSPHNFVLDRCLVGIGLLLVYSMRKRLGGWITIATQVSVTVAAVNFASFLGRSGGEPRYFFGTLIVTLAMFFGFVQNTKAYLIHIICVMSALYFFSSYYDVSVGRFDFLRQLALIYILLLLTSRIMKGYINKIASLRDQRNALLEQQKQTMVDNLKSAQSVFTALGSQESELPESVKLRVHYNPAQDAGGDWVAHYYDRNSNILILALGDVTGHDLGSSLVTIAAASAARSAYENLALRPSDLALVLEGIARSTHSAILHGGVTDKRMTAVFLGLDLTRKEAHYINCAHPSMIVRKEDSANYVATPPSSPLGAEEFSIHLNRFSLDRVRELFIFTDGLTEDPAHPLSDRRFLKEYEKAQDPFSEFSERVKSYSSEDDITFLSLEFN